MSASGPVVVIGGGVIGAAIAQSLAARGTGVVLLERGHVGALPSASGASAALLEPLAGAEPTLAAMAQRSLDRLPGLCDSLRASTGIDPRWSRPGTLFIARRDREAAWLRDVRAPLFAAAGASPSWLNADQALECEPAISPNVIGALRIAATQSVDAPSFTRALVAGAVLHGAVVMTGTPVNGFRRIGRRVVAVQTDTDEIACGQVVLAAGAWTATLARQLGADVPSVAVAPQRGQIMALAPRGTAPRVRHVLHGAGGYAVPKLDGTIIVGATHDDVGFDDSITPDGLRFLGNLVHELIPGLAAETIQRTWCGFRPVWRGQDLPPWGSVGPLENLLVATGYGAIGLTVAAGIGEAVADQVTRR
jgi:glycine oxidase